MIVIERNGIPKTELSAFSTAYELRGNEREFQHVRRQFTSLALQAITEGLVTQREVSELLKPVETASRGSANIFGKDASAFVKLVTNAERLALARRERLLSEGVRENLGAIAVSDEMALLEINNAGPFSPDTTLYCKRDYVSGMRLNTDGTVDPEIVEIDILSDDELRIAEQLSATHTVTQFQLKGRDGEVYRHSSVGIVDGSGAYLPYATILDPAHPVRSQTD